MALCAQIPFSLFLLCLSNPNEIVSAESLNTTIGLSYARHYFLNIFNVWTRFFFFFYKYSDAPAHMRHLVVCAAEKAISKPRERGGTLG